MIYVYIYIYMWTFAKTGVPPAATRLTPPGIDIGRSDPRSDFQDLRIFAAPATMMGIYSLRIV